MTGMSLAHIDEWIIGRFERFGHWTQRAVGIRCTDWERCFLFVKCVCILAAEIPSALRDADVFLAGVFTVVLLFSAVAFADSYRRTSRESFEATVNAARNEAGVLMRLLLLLSVFLFNVARVLASNNANSPWFEISMIAEYFRACDDLPWHKSRLKQLLESLRPVRARRAVPVGA